MIGLSRRLLLLGFTCLIMFTLIGCNSTGSTNSMKIAYIEPSFAINHDNLSELVGFADNIFVGYVEKLEGTEYKSPVSIETEDGLKEVSQPYTNYSVKVIENIKGNLKKDNSIPIQKAGGLSKEENLYLLYEDDFLPEEGKQYIFATFTQPDGSLLVSGPNTNAVIDPEDENDLESSVQFKNYTNAFKSEIKSTRERFTSNFEE